MPPEAPTWGLIPPFPAAYKHRIHAAEKPLLPQLDFSWHFSYIKKHPFLEIRIYFKVLPLSRP
jgi:hypothetical protein